MRVSDLFPDLDGSLKPTADLSSSLLVRRTNLQNDIAVLPISIEKAISNPSSNYDIELQPFDKLIVMPLLSDTSAEDTELLKTKRRESLDIIVDKLKQQVRAGQRAQVVEVAGAVRLPGEYPLLGGGGIDSLIELAGGALDSSDFKTVQVRRLKSKTSGSGVEFESIELDLTQESARKFRLIGRDSIQIRVTPNWNTQNEVRLSGEFLFPGVYKISQGEGIKSLISRAGGFTDDAFIKGARYVSASAKRMQRMQLKKIAATVDRQMASRRVVGGGDASLADQGSAPSVTYFMDAISDDQLGRMVIDLEGIVNGDVEADVIVQDGDVIDVPKFSNAIGVVGEVYEPGTYSYEVDLTMADYIKKAGGETVFSLRRNTYVLRADGSVEYARPGFWSGLSSFKAVGGRALEPGDVIVVPTNLDYETPLAHLTGVTNVVFQSFTSIAAFLSIAR